MEHSLHADDVTPESIGGTAEARRLFDRSRGCDLFSQRLVRVDAGGAAGGADLDAEQLVYVVRGRGRLTVAGAEHVAEPGVAAFVPVCGAWSLDADEELHAVVVAVHGPDPGSDAPEVVRIGDDGASHAATAGREFSLGAACASATQFVGRIPPGRAPDHFHTYDEVVYVLEGRGTLHIGGETAPLRPGTAVHLPARLVHSLENEGEGEMLVLGVFRPAGSPAEAYYPDGTPAAVPQQ